MLIAALYRIANASLRREVFSHGFHTETADHGNAPLGKGLSPPQVAREQGGLVAGLPGRACC